MRVLCVLLLCLLSLGGQGGQGAKGCQVLLELDSNQQWEFVRNFYVGLRGGQGYLAAPVDRGDRVGLLDSWKGAGKRTKWFYRNGMLWSQQHSRYVLTVQGESLVLSMRGTPAQSGQEFLYVNGTLQHRETGMFLTGWEEEPRVTMETGGEGCKQTPVVHLLNEQWQLEGSLVRSLWTGAVLTRQQGQTQLTALPYNRKDKSLQQRWYWQNGFLRESKSSVVTILETGQMVAQRPMNTPNQRFLLSEGFIENIQSRKIMYIPKDGNGLQLREKHIYV